MTREGATPSPPTVLLADDDLFERGYVEAVLAARGIAVVRTYGPAPEQAPAGPAPGLSAAVVAGAGTHALLDALERDGIPCLVLGPDGRAPPGRFTLARPFAAHQVAEWVLQVLDRPPG